ncbi:hypothetical protein [Candidatus Rariloculus sp.]|uniref:hypothetical protein n=1 Tax=Candidatus Rariloculus sp. TaxID=3101265 RepID=UPI003D0F24A9
MSADRAAVEQQLPPVIGSGVAVGILAGVFVLGAASLIYALTNDPGQIDFALLTVTFLFLMGVSQGGIVFCAIMRLVGAQWSKPFYRLAEICTLSFAPFALIVFLLIFVFAREDLFYWLSLSAEAREEEHLSSWLNSDWLLIRNLFGMLLFYGVSAVYAIKALQPDLPTVPGGPLNMDHSRIEQELYVMSPWVILSFALCSTLFAWDFGMMLVAHWHSTVFPIFFSFGNVFAGTAALMFLVAVFGRSEVTNSHFGPDQIRSLGMLVTGFTVLWLYFFWAQFFVVWFGNLPRETDVLWPQMYGHYAPYYWTMMFGCFFVPFVALVFAYVKRSAVAMIVLAIGINIGIWMHKYLTVVPAFSPDDTPFDSWLDIVLAVGLLAGYLAVFVMIAKRVPIYSYWEIGRNPARRR